MGPVTQGRVGHGRFNTQPGCSAVKRSILIQILVQSKHHAHVLVVAQLEQALGHSQNDGAV